MATLKSPLKMSENDPALLWKSTGIEDKISRQNVRSNSFDLSRLIRAHNLFSVVYFWPVNKDRYLAFAGTVVTAVAPPATCIWLGNRLRKQFFTGDRFTRTYVTFFSLGMCGMVSCFLHYAMVLQPLANRLERCLPCSMGWQATISSIFGAVAPCVFFPTMLVFVSSGLDRHPVRWNEYCGYMFRRSKPVILKRGPLALLTCIFSAAGGVWLENRAFSNMADALDCDPEFYDEMVAKIKVEAERGFWNRFFHWLAV